MAHSTAAEYKCEFEAIKRHPIARPWGVYCEGLRQTDRTVPIFYLFAAIACSRHFGVFFPLRSELWLTKQRVAGIVTGIILCPLLFSIITSLKYYRWQQGDRCFLVLFYRPWVVSVITAHSSIIFSIVIMIYVKICRVALRLQRQISIETQVAQQGTHKVSHPGHIMEAMERRKAHLKTLKNFSIIAGCYVLIWLPTLCTGNYMAYRPVHELRETDVVTQIGSLQIMVIICPITNQVVYAVKFKWFRALFRYLFCKLSIREFEEAIVW